MLRDLATGSDTLTRQKLEILSKLGDASAPAAPSRPRIRLAYHLTPEAHRSGSSGGSRGMEFAVTGTDEVRQLDAGLVLTSIGYHGKADSGSAVRRDRRRGARTTGAVSSTRTPGNRCPAPTSRAGSSAGRPGFIGTNKSCAAQTVQRLVDDFNAGLLRDPSASRQHWTSSSGRVSPTVVDAAGWRAIDAAEVARGGTDDRPRNKFTSIADMLDCRGRPRRRRHCGAGWPTDCANWRISPSPSAMTHRGGDLLAG